MKKVPLTRGLFTIVDDGDYDIVSEHNWYAHSRGDGKFYAARRETGSRSLVLMHRQINSTPADALTDHIDGDTLNNQRANLRSASALENARNQSKQSRQSMKGAWFDASGRSSRKWRSAIRVNGRLKYLGRFFTQEEAAAAYAIAAASIFGEFARKSA